MDKNILEMKNSVINAYADLFKCSLSEAKETVGASGFMKVLTVKPLFTMNYSDEYWAEKICEKNILE